MDNNQIQRIFSEETLRIRIRTELQPEQAPQSRFVKFLNSSFGLLLLSSVVIGGLGKLYTDKRERIEKESATQQELIKLKAEFNHRFKYATDFLGKLKAAQGRPDEAQGQSILLWRTIVGDKAFMPALPEYKENHWGGILARMESLGIDASSEVENAIYDLDFAKKENWMFDPERVEKNLKTIDGFRQKLRQ